MQALTPGLLLPGCRSQGSGFGGLGFYLTILAMFHKDRATASEQGELLIHTTK